MGTRQSSQLGPDRLNHAVHIFHHFIVPEADEAVTLRLDQSGARLIPLILAMLAPIKFDHQPLRSAQEIGNERTYRHLARKLVPKLAAAEPSPQSALRRSCLVAKCLSSLGRALAELRHRWLMPLLNRSGKRKRSPHPQPLPRAGGEIFEPSRSGGRGEFMPASSSPARSPWRARCWWRGGISLRPSRGPCPSSTRRQVRR